MAVTEEKHRFMKRDIDEELVWALHSPNPSLDRVKQLVGQGADLNAPDYQRRSVLMHAVLDSRVTPEIIRFLVEQGANVNDTDVKGDSVLMRALCNRKLVTETVELLLSRGADVNVLNDTGNTALMYAVRSFRPQESVVEIIRLLIEGGADVNAADSLGYTVIMHALANVPKLPMKAIEYLISQGAVIDYTDGELLPTVAFRCEPEAVAFLLNNGANPNVVLDGFETVVDWVEYYTRFLLDNKPRDEETKEVRRQEVERLSSIFRLLVQAGAKRGRELIEP
jgi:ankyrin repeat protein